MEGEAHRGQRAPALYCYHLLPPPPFTAVHLHLHSQSIRSWLKLLESRFLSNFTLLPVYCIRFFSGRQAFKLPPLWI